MTSVRLLRLLSKNSCGELPTREMFKTTCLPQKYRFCIHNASVVKLSERRDMRCRLHLYPNLLGDAVKYVINLLICDNKKVKKKQSCSTLCFAAFFFMVGTPLVCPQQMRGTPTTGNESNGPVSLSVFVPERDLPHGVAILAQGSHRCATASRANE